MKLRKNKLLTKNKYSILENVKQAKQYIKSGKLSQEDLKTLIEIDPTKNRKFVGWMAKQWIKGNIPSKNVLGSTIEEYYTFLEKNKVKTKDIYQFKSFEDLKKEVDDLNQSGSSLSIKDLEKDYEVVVDNSDMIIAVPHTHEASRKLGLSIFSFRDCGDGTKDSNWCTTYKTPDHFNDYYYSYNITLYYIKIKSKKIALKIKEAFPEKWENMLVTAIAVYDDGELEGYDGTDNELNENEISKFVNILGI